MTALRRGSFEITRGLTLQRSRGAKINSAKFRRLHGWIDVHSDGRFGRRCEYRSILFSALSDNNAEHAQRPGGAGRKTHV